jgi:hypothetical protein
MIVVLAAVLLPLTVNAQAPSPAKETPKETGKDTPKAYVPGLEQFMNVILMEHNKLWFAAKAHNWALAEYQLGEIKEIMGDVQDFVPTFKNLPLADMLDAVITKEIASLEKSIEERLQGFYSGLRQAHCCLQRLPPGHGEWFHRYQAANAAGVHQSGLRAAQITVWTATSIGAARHRSPPRERVLNAGP